MWNVSDLFSLDFRKILSAFISFGTSRLCEYEFLAHSSHAQKIVKDGGTGEKKKWKPNSSVNNPTHNIATVIPQYPTLLEIQGMWAELNWEVK